MSPLMVIAFRSCTETIFHKILSLNEPEYNHDVYNILQNPSYCLFVTWGNVDYGVINIEIPMLLPGLGTVVQFGCLSPTSFILL